MVFEGQLCALKRIPKTSIDKAKRIEHLKNEKKICLMLQKVTEKPAFFIRLHETFTEADTVNLMFEFMPGQDLYNVI